MVLITDDTDRPSPIFAIAPLTRKDAEWRLLGNLSEADLRAIGGQMGAAETENSSLYSTKSFAKAIASSPTTLGSYALLNGQLNLILVRPNFRVANNAV